jgi:predicted ATPase
LAVYIETAEMTYLNNDFNEISRLTTVIIEHSRSIQDRMCAYDIRIRTHIASNQLQESVDLCLKILKSLRISVPPRITNHVLLYNFLLININITKKTKIGVINQLDMLDPHLQAITRLISLTFFPLFIISQKLFFYPVFKQILLFLKHGNFIWSSFAYACLAFIVGGPMKNLTYQSELSKIALALLDKYPSAEVKPKFLAILHDFVIH